MAGIRLCGFRASLSFRVRHAIMRKEGERLAIEPCPPKSLLALLATLAPLDEEFPPIADPHAEPVVF
jgi:antitoxin VapB